MIKKIAITTGDSDGIGLEVTCKALAKLGGQKNIQFVVYYQKKSQEVFLKKLSKRFQKNQLELLHDSRSPALWIEDIVVKQISGEYAGLVTGPLSKPEIKRAGLLDIGHTDILRRATKTKTAYMCFLGKKFNIALATGHIPLDQVSNSISVEKLVDLCLQLNQLIKNNFPKKSDLPIGILGLNPHAGDSGLIGQGDDVVANAISQLKKMKIQAVGPLVPDAAILPSEWKKYCFYVALYHDQGLIPFKMAHQRAGSHLTLGVPILRTSVDHGTAHDIFGMNKADSRSMLDALKLCVKLVRSRDV